MAGDVQAVILSRGSMKESFTVSTSDEEAVKRRYREFLDLLPLTIAIAGLPQSEGNRNYTSEQLETRAQVLSNAFKLAKQTAREVLRGSSG